MKSSLIFSNFSPFLSLASSARFLTMAPKSEMKPEKGLFKQVGNEILDLGE